MSNIERALAAVLDGSPPNTLDEDQLRRIVVELDELGCLNIDGKLNESKAARQGGRLGSLLAELRFARSLSQHLGCTITFQVGDQADLRFVTEGIDCLLEVVHKSSSDPWSAVFHPDPADLDRYPLGNAWQRAAHRLHTTIMELPIEIQPWVAAEFIRELVDGRCRTAQERACGDVATWLAEQLPDAVHEGRTALVYHDRKTCFELTPLETAPGYVKGTAPVEGWFIAEDRLRQSIKKKSEKASGRLLANGADCYFVGLAIDDSFAASGHDILGTLFGTLVHCDTTGRTFRPVPADHRFQIIEARQRGLENVLNLAALDPDQNDARESPKGLFFDPALSEVSGILVLYYTDTLQFIPNPFSTKDSAQVRSRFPNELTPFSPLP
jgi:hypothetical protein